MKHLFLIICLTAICLIGYCQHVPRFHKPVRDTSKKVKPVKVPLGHGIVIFRNTPVFYITQKAGTTTMHVQKASIVWVNDSTLTYTKK